MDLLLRLVQDSPITGQNLLSVIVLGMARVFPLMIYAPFLGANLLPSQVKVGFALCLVAILLPKLLGTMTTLPTWDLMLVIMMVKEFFIGAIIGFLASLPFQVMSTSGILIDNQRGTGSMSIRDPTQGIQSSPIGIIYNYMLIALFLGAGGATAFIDAFQSSYDLVPPDSWIHPSFFHMNDFWQFVTSLFGKVVALALQLAAPPFIAMLMTDLFLGIINRLAPQVQIAFLGMSLKSLVASVVLFVGWMLIMKTALLETQNWMGTIPGAIKMMTAHTGH
ncbi:MAG: EscT/YscT/HrcT family type III secretion system export apparatus protein [Chlamydiia bacterium]